jgi:hypothetical protein
VEPLPWVDAKAQLYVWMRGHQAAVDRHEGMNVNQVVDITDAMKNLKPANQGDDVLLYVGYQKGDPIVTGDLYVFKWKDGKTVREARAVTATHVQTVSGTKIPLTDVLGVVKRVIRVTN